MNGRLVRALGLLAATAVLSVAVGRAWASLNLPAPLVGEVPDGKIAVPTGAAAPPGVLLVVIDGLRADVAETLPFLSRLADAGGRARTWADPPTISAAQYVALLAGVPPRDSGVRTNATLRAAGVDDVAHRARAAGLHTAVVSDGVNWWPRLFPTSFEAAAFVPPPQVLPEVRRLAANGGLLVVHLCAVDDAGHAYGARSREYAAAAAAADRVTADLAQIWGWPRADVVVTADHGHRDRGGHGGTEADVRASFVVAAGPDIERGARVDDARSVDVAPTIAALLGVAPPAAASGRTLVELLGIPPARRQALLAADADRQARVAAAVAVGRASATAAARRARIVRAIGVAFLVAFLVTRRRPALRAFARGLGALAATAAAFTLLFGPLSFSAARGAGVWISALAAIAFVATAIALWFGARRHEGTRAVFGTVTALALPALAAFVHAGLFAHRLDCEPAWLAVGPAWANTILAAACAAGAAGCWFMTRADALRHGQSA